MAAPHPGDIPVSDPLADAPRPAIGSMNELRQVLSARGDVEALGELVYGDRLRMLDRTYRWLTTNCYLLDRRALVYDSVAMVVAGGVMITGEEDMDAWVEATIDIAARGLLDRDKEVAARSPRAEEPFEPRFMFLMQTLMFSPRNVRLAMVAANGAPRAERHVFYHTMIEGTGLDAYAREHGLKRPYAQELFLNFIDRMSAAVGDIDE